MEDHIYPVREFKAFTDCPSCGMISLHDMSEPPDSEPGWWEGQTFELGSAYIVRNWSGEALISVRDSTIYRIDKTTCDVVRRCVCGAEWGEK